MRFSPGAWLLTSLVVTLAAEVLVLGSRGGMVALAAAPLWMALPGVVLVRAVLGTHDRSHVGAWLIGPALGIGASVFGVFLLWAAHVQSWLAIVAGPALTWGLALASRRLG